MRHTEERGDGVKMLTRREKRVLKRLRTTDWVPSWSWDVYTMAKLLRLGVFGSADQKALEDSKRIDELAANLRTYEICTLVTILGAIVFVATVLIDRLV